MLKTVKLQDTKYGVTLDKTTNKLVVVKIQDAKYGITRNKK